MVGAGVAIATLVAAEWPIYGRFGDGPAMDACGYDVDARAARFLAPASGTTERVTPAELEPPLTAMHDARWASPTGSLRRRPGHRTDKRREGKECGSYIRTRMSPE